MAKIPTINAQNITPPPGTAGGLLMGRVGTSNVQVKTPLTQQMNPRNFGQQGEMVAQLGNTLLNDVFLPMLEKERANARAKQSMEAQTDVLKEINDVKGKLEKKEMVFGDDYHHGAGLEPAWEKHWKGIDTQLDLIIPNMQSRVDNKTGAALSSNYIPQVMALKLKAQTTRGKVSESRTVTAYQDGSRALAQEMAKYVPENLNPGGEEKYLFKEAYWNSLLQKKELLNNIFENSNIDPAVKASTRESTRKSFIDELSGAFKVNPRMGMEFVRSGMGEQFGLTRGEAGEMLSDLNDQDFANTKANIFKQEQQESREEREAAKALAPVRVQHLEFAVARKYTLEQWDELYRPMYEAAGPSAMEDFRFARNIIKGGEDLPGTTIPSVLTDYQFELLQIHANPGEFDIKATADKIAVDKRLSTPDKLSMIKELVNLGNADNLVKLSSYTRAKALLTKSAPVPLDGTDSKGASLRSRELWRLFLDDTNRLIKDPEKFQQFDWYDRVTQIIDEYSGNHSSPSDAGSQIIFRDRTRSFPVQDSSLYVSQGKQIFPDVVAMETLLQGNRKNLTTDQIKEATDSISVIRSFQGLSGKVSEIKKAIELANQPEKPKELTDTEKVLRNITPDKWEEMGKKQFPELYKSIFGQTPEPAPVQQPEAATPEPTPAPPKPAPVKADPRQAEMFKGSDNPAVNVPGPRDVPPIPQLDFSKPLADAQNALQYLKENAEANGYDEGLINLLELTMLALQNDAMGNDPESFQKSVQLFMKQVGDIQGKQ